MVGEPAEAGLYQALVELLMAALGSQVFALTL